MLCQPTTKERERRRLPAVPPDRDPGGARGAELQSAGSGQGGRAGADPAAPALEQKPANLPGRDLSVDESMGGHTLARHVGKIDAELLQRLRREPQISAASTYTDRTSAESVVGAALAARGRSEMPMGDGKLPGLFHLRFAITCCERQGFRRTRVRRPRSHRWRTLVQTAGDQGHSESGHSIHVHPVASAFRGGRSSGRRSPSTSKGGSHRDRFRLRARLGIAQAAARRFAGSPGLE
jgi:Bacterial CdiA-CT RNAse A domain